MAVPFVAVSAMAVPFAAMPLMAMIMVLRHPSGFPWRWNSQHGIRTVDILPLGQRRAEFEAAMRRRWAATSREEICGSLQAQYDRAFPAWFPAR